VYFAVIIPDETHELGVGTKHREVKPLQFLKAVIGMNVAKQLLQLDIHETDAPYAIGNIVGKVVHVVPYDVDAFEVAVSEFFRVYIMIQLPESVILAHVDAVFDSKRHDLRSFAGAS
jgi:hypothetical protein